MIQAWLKEEFSKQTPLDELISYHLQPGGKCLRGHLALLECSRWGVPEAAARGWALVCELLHNATLIHDDIQDNDHLRRGQPSLWSRYGVAQALNAGDLLIFRAFLRASELGCPDLIALLARTSETLVEGQAQELTPSNQSGPRWETYCTMARNKTGALFTLPVEGAALLAGQRISEAQLNAWSGLGLAYQIYDDLRDFHGLKQSGQIGKDFEERRLNSLIAYWSQLPTSQVTFTAYLQGDHVDWSLLRADLETSGTLQALRLYADDLIQQFRDTCDPQVWGLLKEYFERALPTRSKEQKDGDFVEQI